MSASNLGKYLHPSKAKGSPSGHKEGKATPLAPVKAVETKLTPSAPTLGPKHSSRDAAIALLVAGKILTKKPVTTQK